MADMKKLIFTNDNCVGCNKCINVCSAMGACISTEADETHRSRINVDTERCVACGACFDACEHNAREYIDDTDSFLNDLAAGESISLLIAPAFQANYPDEYERVLGGLKSLGVNHIINVAFGADITTWGYIQYIKKYDFTGGISQPCPAVVTYIEKYLPELLPYLFPVQSPLMCAAIYARNEMKITDKFAFISPCIAKKLEICHPENEGLVNYNVTFSHLMKIVREKKLYGEPISDEIEYGLGTIYPMPGGLKEHVKWFLGDSVFIRQIEGERHMYEYLKTHAQAIVNKDIPFLFIDALNCENGCLCGTATDPELSFTDQALFSLLKIQDKVKNVSNDATVSRTLNFSERLDALNKKFEKLDLSDYLRSYRDLSSKCSVRTPESDDLEHIFISMGKETFSSRNINCMSCGYDSCYDMAIAIYNGFNHRENCVYYLKATVEKSQHDELLGIYNRRYALEYFANTENDEKIFSVVMIDIDGFKGINATYGHGYADEILKQAANRLKKLEFGGAQSLLARYGGDQFMLLLDEQLTEDHPKINIIREVFDKPFVHDSIALKLTVCMGVCNSDGRMSVEERVNFAEEAVCEAKKQGMDKIFFYSDEMLKKEIEEKRISTKIIEAFENDGFYMVYQPKVDVKELALSGYEALIRMKEAGIGPAKFIPIAEKKGWIWKIGRISTEMVIRQLASWRDEGHELHPISINYSSNQLSDEGYVEFLKKLLEKYDIESKYVEIEITESVLLTQTVQTNELFNQFSELGIRLLMDDFGTGYSSLGYLTYIPVDIVKLDKSLVDNYLVEGKDRFIDDVIRLVHDLNKEMIVEGVEEKWQYLRLKEFGADTIQGYYFSKPLPPDEAIRFIPDIS